MLNEEPGPYPHPDPSNAGTVTFCDLVTLLWNIPAVSIPGFDTALGTGAALTPHNHVASQFPTKTWHQDEYVRLDKTINAPSKLSAWAAETPGTRNSPPKQI